LLFLQLSEVLIPENLLHVGGMGIIAGLSVGIFVNHCVFQTKLVDYFYGARKTPCQKKQKITKCKNFLDRFFPAKVNFAILILALIVEVYFTIFRPSYENLLLIVMLGYFTFYFATIPLAIRIFLPKM
jgi:hypothetical protein